jgi:TPR repeat protein
MPPDHHLAEWKMSKSIAGLVFLLVVLSSCQTNGVKNESQEEQACARGEAKSCAVLGGVHEHGAHDYAKAVEFYEKACALEDYAACAEVARVHSFFKPNFGSWKRIQIYAQKACDANVPRGCAYRVLAYYFGEERDVAKAFALAEKACAENEGTACNGVGDMYRLGVGVTRDRESAQQFFLKAAALYQRECDAGHMFDCGSLGFLYANGYGVAQDMAKALPLLQQSCDAGIAPTCTYLVQLYELGIYVEKDAAKVVHYREKACDSGIGSFCFLQGLTWNGVEKNAAKAASLWQKGCDFDHDTSCEYLGNLYMTGANGVAQDKERGMALYAKTLALQKNGCENDEDALACERLGDAYEKGEIVSRDSAKSAAAYEMALAQWQRGCDKGNDTSCRALARMQEAGKGVARETSEVPAKGRE